MPRPGNAARVAASCALLAAICVTCDGARLAPVDAAARVGRQTLLYDDFEQYVATQVGLDTATSSLVLSGLFDQFLDEVLLRQMAIDENKATLETPGWEVLDALLASEAEASVPQQEVVAYYRAHRAEFSRPEQVVLRQVLAEDRDTAGEIAELLRQGVDFDDLAARFLDEGVSASEDEIAREDLPAAFVDTIFELEPGQVSDVVAADYGFHVFQVVHGLPAHELTLAEAAPEIIDRLGRRDRRRRLAELVAQARARYNVEVYARNLPFNYEGKYDSPEI